MKERKQTNPNALARLDTAKVGPLGVLEEGDVEDLRDVGEAGDLLPSRRRG